MTTKKKTTTPKRRKALSPAERDERAERRRAERIKAEVERQTAVYARFPLGYRDGFIRSIEGALETLVRVLEHGHGSVAPGGVPWACVELVAARDREIAKLEAQIAHLGKREKHATNGARALVEYLATARKHKLEIERGPRKPKVRGDEIPF